jgi:SAM-dependent methyltransferase
MISVICVYNDKAMMERVLLPSLKGQTIEYEFIPVDNTENYFNSAAFALNHGATRAKSKYLMFVHQDVELSSNTWLEDTEKVLDILPNLGIAGSIGVVTQGSTPKERIRGCVCNGGMNMGEPLTKPVEVQTLDECLLIVPRANFFGFDSKTFNDWHCYGADYCLTAQEHGLKAYAIPAYVYHRSMMTNTRALWKHQRKLYWKHRKHFSHIHMTTGSISGTKALIIPILAKLYQFYFHYRKDWIGLACKELADCKTILDVGCGYNSPLQYIRKDGKEHHLVGIDIFKPYLEESRKKQLHDHYAESDLMLLELPDNSFEGIFCSEVIEHLTKQEGVELLKRMNRWAYKKLVITTPNGYLRQQGKDNPYQEHKSGWTMRELKSFGFTTIRGMGGLKCLRSRDNAEIRFRPSYLFAALSIVSQALTDNLPALAFQLLAIKRK